MMLFLKPSTIIDIASTIIDTVGLLIIVVSILVAMADIANHRPAKGDFFAGFMVLYVFAGFMVLCGGAWLLYKSFNSANNNPKPKPFVFTTLDWQILVGLVLAVLILVVIIYWLLLKRDNRLGLIKRLFYASILGNALFEAALAIGKNVLHSTLDSKTSFIAFSIMLALIILTLMLKEFYRVQKYHQVQIYGI